MNPCCAEENLQAYLDGELSPPARDAAAEHLAECVVCAARVQEAEWARMMMSSAWANELPEMIPTARLRARVNAALAEQVAPQFGWWWNWQLAAVAAALLLTLSLWLVRQTHKPPREPHLVARTVPKELPQDNPGMTAKTAATPPSIERRRRVRAPQTPRSIRPQPRAPIVPEIVVADAPDSDAATEFIPLRYDDDHKPMESGEVIRVQMPRSALIALGLPVQVERADESVKADLLLGEDGLARAIRFVR
jgi:Putative zinc-finger